jgi:MerR HTH family regulatory protein
MTKEEVAKVLGVNPRTVQRYVAQGLLHPKYKKGSRGKVADFSDREVKNLKKQLSAGEESKPRTALKPITVPIYQKLVLSIEEAIALAGLPKEFVEQAIEKGSLKVVRKDGKLYVKRKDLEGFVNRL